MKRSIVLVLLLAACGSVHGETRTSAPTVLTEAPAPTTPDTTAPNTFPGTVVLTTKEGDIVSYPDGGEPQTMKAVQSPTGTVAVSATDGSASSTIEWHDLATGSVTTSVTVAGQLHPAAVTQDGKLVALFQSGGGFTIVVLVSPTSGELRRWTIDADVVPEAFANAYSEDGLPIGVFVLEYLAAHTYRVRVIDTATGTLSLPLNLRDKSQTVDEVMTAVSRTAVFEPMHQLLFTLYQDASEGDENVGAFIHTLGLINGVWCLDVPPELGLADHPGALAVSPDGSHLYAASGTGGVAGFVVDDVLNPDTAMPAARATIALPANADRVAVAASDEEVVVALGSEIFRLDPQTLAVRESFTWDMDVEAVTILPDRSLLIVGTGRMTLVAPDHRQLLAERPIGTVGEVTRVAVV